MLPDSAVDLKTKIYKSDESCAAFLFPFKNFIFDPLVVKEIELNLNLEVSDKVLKQIRCPILFNRKKEIINSTLTPLVTVLNTSYSAPDIPKFNS